ncbi:hypothetical protein LXL04_009629 [Taraxacum kok-saghyz]
MRSRLQFSVFIHLSPSPPLYRRLQAIASISVVGVALIPWSAGRTSSPTARTSSPLVTSVFIFSEENVYLLCKKLCADGVDDVSDLFVIFISNENKHVPLWHQKASHRADGIILWDYHVICIQLKLSRQCSLKAATDTPHRYSCNKKGWCFACEFEGFVVKAAKSGSSPVSPIRILSQIQNIEGILGMGDKKMHMNF